MLRCEGGHTFLQPPGAWPGHQPPPELGGYSWHSHEKPRPQTLTREAKNIVRNQLAFASQTPWKALEGHFSIP